MVLEQLDLCSPTTRNPCSGTSTSPDDNDDNNDDDDDDEDDDDDYDNDDNDDEQSDLCFPTTRNSCSDTLTSPDDVFVVAVGLLFENTFEFIDFCAPPRVVFANAALHCTPVKPAYATRRHDLYPLFHLMGASQSICVSTPTTSMKYRSRAMLCLR